MPKMSALKNINQEVPRPKEDDVVFQDLATVLKSRNALKRFGFGIICVFRAVVAGLILLLPFNGQSQTKDSFIGNWHGSGFDVTITRDGEGFVFDCKHPNGELNGIFKLTYADGNLKGLGIYGDVGYLPSEDSILVDGVKLKRSSANAAPHEDPLLTEVRETAKGMFLTNVLQIDEFFYFEVKSPQANSALFQAKDVHEKTQFSEVSDVDKLNGLECRGEVDFTAKFTRKREPAALIQGSPQDWSEWSEYGLPLWICSFEKRNGNWKWKGEWQTHLLGQTTTIADFWWVIGAPSRDLLEKPATPSTGSVTEPRPANPAGEGGALASIKEGRAKLLQKDYAGAINEYTRAIGLTRRAAGAYEGRGFAKRMLKDYDGAVADFSKAIELSPKFTTAYNERGITKSALKDYHGAIADYTQAIELNPKDAVFYDNRGTAKRSLNDYDGAINDHSQAIQLNSTNSVFYDHRGNAKYSLKDYYGAIADYTQAVALDPKASILYDNRGNAKRDLKDYEGAIADYIKSIDVRTAQANQGSPWLPTIRQFLDGTLTETEFLQRAINAESDSKAQSNRVCQVNYYAGIKHLKAGDRAGAIDLFNKCLDTGQSNNVTFKGAEMELKSLKNESTK